MQVQKEWLDNHDDYGLVRTNGYYVQEDNLSIDCNLFEVNEYMKIKEKAAEHSLPDAMYQNLIY